MLTDTHNWSDYIFAQQFSVLMLEFLWKPQTDINYNFIAISFAIAFVIGLVLYVLDIIYAIEAVHGYWIVFVPYAPCLLWVGFMKMQEKKVSTETKEKKS